MDNLTKEQLITLCNAQKELIKQLMEQETLYDQNRKALENRVEFLERRLGRS